MPKPLTTASVEKLKPRASSYDVPDGLLPCFYVTVQPSAKKSWIIRYRHCGRTRKFKIGDYPLMDLATARKLAREALRKVAEGRDPGTEKQEALAAARENDPRTVFTSFVVKHCKPRGNRRWKETAQCLGLKWVDDKTAAELGLRPEHHNLVPTGRSILEAWKRKQSIRDITAADITALLDDLVDAGKTPMAIRQRSVLVTLFKWAKRRGIVLTNPCLDVDKPGKDMSRDRVLTDAELVLVWNACDALGWPFGPMTKLLLLTGQRRDMVANLRWSEIDFEARMWTLPAARMKSDKPHLVPLSRAVIDILQSLPRMTGSDLVFSTTGATAISGFSRAKRKLDNLITPPIAHWTLHDCRRTLASGLQRLGVSLQVSESVLAHTSGSIRGVARVYHRHDFAPEKRHALDAWAAHVAAVVSGEAKGNVVSLQRVRS